MPLRLLAVELAEDPQAVCWRAGSGKPAPGKPACHVSSSASNGCPSTANRATVVDAPDLGPGTGAGLFQIDRLDEDGGRMRRVHSDNELFFIPGIAYSRHIDAHSSWGVTVYGNGGLSTEYRRGMATFAAGDGTGALGITENREGAFGGGERTAGAGALRQPSGGVGRGVGQKSHKIPH